ncbi:RagB/SusD family nutrient uptake outer membrane protein [Solitalea longa]|nr:RagB/SusD family nutrient uptake outer membrane protein [Solitalea longa]
MTQLTKQKNKASAFVALGCILLSFTMLVSLSGCEKFLELPVKDKVPQDKLFTDEQGFIDALTGIYVGMDKPTNGGPSGLYTTDLTMGLVSTVANNYPAASTFSGKDGLYANAAKYDYMSTVVRREIDGIWGGMYNNIANVNNLLSHIDAKRAVFSLDRYQRVKGEAYALRALFHFDLARLYGQNPVTGLNDKAIPYVTTFSAVSTPFVPLNVALDSCISDLKKATVLLAQTDTTALNKVSLDLFNGFTQNHLNYWATKALLARVYMYKGDYANAEKYAHEVIGSNKFPLITNNVNSASSATRDRMFSQELLFSVYCNNLRNYSDELFSISSGVSLRFPLANQTTLYGGQAPTGVDWRLTWFEKNNNNNSYERLTKYTFDTSPEQYGMLQSNVPVLRISEMYYIAAECANRNGDIANGLIYLNSVRRARGLADLTNITNSATLTTEITKEHQKEFIQEGQTFFYYKRLNLDLKAASGTTAVVTVPETAYVFPIPDKENEFNR